MRPISDTIHKRGSNEAGFHTGQATAVGSLLYTRSISSTADCQDSRPPAYPTHPGQKMPGT